MIRLHPFVSLFLLVLLGLGLLEFVYNQSGAATVQALSYGMVYPGLLFWIFIKITDPDLI